MAGQRPLEPLNGRARHPAQEILVRAGSLTAQVQTTHLVVKEEGTSVNGTRLARRAETRAVTSATCSEAVSASAISRSTSASRCATAMSSRAVPWPGCPAAGAPASPRAGPFSRPAARCGKRGDEGLDQGRVERRAAVLTQRGYGSGMSSRATVRPLGQHGDEAIDDRRQDARAEIGMSRPLELRG